MENTEIQLPSWMNEHKNYSPARDKKGFLTKTVLGFLRLFRHFHVEKNERITVLRAGLRTILVIGLIILLALSRSSGFYGLVAAGFLTYLCFAKTEILKKTLATAFTAAAFSVLIMLPSFLIYKSDSIFVISAKVFISTGLISLFSLLTPWNKITAALKVIHLPGFLIFILDLTIHYILILGNAAYDMLFALKLRSTGKNNDKKGSISGIIGTVFLKSTQMTKETQMAMECRLFNGTYFCEKIKPKPADFISILVLAVYICIFIYTF